MFLCTERGSYRNAIAIACFRWVFFVIAFSCSLHVPDRRAVAEENVETLSSSKAEKPGELDTNQTKTENVSEPKIAPPGGESSEEQLEQAFKAADKDHDGHLIEAEFLSMLPKVAIPEGKRDWLVFDLDHDGKLTPAEFRNIPSRAARSVWGTLPFPFAKLVDEQMAPIKMGWGKWDLDQNSTLNEAEFQTSGLARSIPSLGLSDWRTWDRDGDGKVSQNDCRWLLEAAYGQRRLDGTLLYLSTGRIVHRWRFQRRDKNRDERITREEFLRDRPDPTGLRARFKGYDLDGNGEVSFKEWAESLDQNSDQKFDPIAAFLRIDKDLNGQVDPAELKIGITSVEETEKSLMQLLDSVFPGFDLNSDGTLSLDEFRGTMLMNRVELWLDVQQDLDHDARLSPAEFSWTPGLELSLLKAEYFRRLDINRSGYLETNEFRFKISPDQISPEILFRARDRNTDGRLTLGEVVQDLRIKPVPANNRAYEAQVVRIEEAFLKADSNHDKSLSWDEFNTPQGASVLVSEKALKSRDLRSLRSEPVADSSRSWLVPVLVINVLAVGGVIAYLFFKR